MILQTGTGTEIMNSNILRLFYSLDEISRFCNKVENITSSEQKMERQ